MTNGVDPARFRSIAGSLPTGVTVLTTLDDHGDPMGMTLGAVCGLSCEPPLLLTCVNSGSRTLAAIRRNGTFCVNVLDADAAWLSARFAGDADDRFAGVEWTPGAGGLPVLTGNIVAYAACEKYRTVSGGDHMIVIGLIIAGDHDPQAAPLLYHRRRYAGFPGLYDAADPGR
ncbi:flavin reductase family protein [Actinocrispum wychmicini]|uniref:3-hydroxy-9,10-secoandrosta-1,3,5(10)-triene-9, 17-dione monooxygenase reductase component n=1 Tax=Actinocrispum wychmicini TaxID=1213861 RepID=A0A4R2JZA2_9PSEU|nr:flavin reductase family protein [Actinocrispum wychmicini]TCO62756.1 3-hydroxy-9,10-secoandrosta-1,3,5(10)-triene-9,17-dione monooxygenase reductase component [Actinocrispum wychmicini]